MATRADNIYSAFPCMQVIMTSYITFQTDCSTEISTKTHVEIPVEMMEATYANGTQ